MKLSWMFWVPLFLLWFGLTTVFTLRYLNQIELQASMTSNYFVKYVTYREQCVLEYQVSGENFINTNDCHEYALIFLSPYDIKRINKAAPEFLKTLENQIK